MSGRRGAASSYLLQAKGIADGGLERTFSVVLDFGPGAMGQLLEYVDPAMLDAMVFSHLHADHCADIVGMQVYRRWHPEGALPPVTVYSPGDGMRRTRQIADDAPEETYAGEFDFVRVAPGSAVRIGPMMFEFFQAEHTVEALSLRVTGPSEAESRTGESRTVVFSFTGDTDYCDGALAAARGVDLLLSEAAFEEGRDEVRGVHLTGTRAGELAHDAGAKQVVLTHLQPWTDADKTERDASQAYGGKVELAEPGAVYEI